MQSIDSPASWTVTEGDVYIDNDDPWTYDGNNSLNLTAANPNEVNADRTGSDHGRRTTYKLNFWADSNVSNTLAITVNGVAVTGASTLDRGVGFPAKAIRSQRSRLRRLCRLVIATSTSTTLLFTADSDLPIGSSFLRIDRDRQRQRAGDPGARIDRTAADRHRRHGTSRGWKNRLQQSASAN